MKQFSEYIKDYTDNKTICILGFGREGKSTYKMIEKYCSPKALAIADLNDIDREANGIPENVDLICGKDYQQCLDRFDMVFKSLGIVLEKPVSQLTCQITCETQVFFECFREQIIGITGTKGKSTVTSMIYHILKESGKDAYIAGNIGIPLVDKAIREQEYLHAQRFRDHVLAHIVAHHQALRSFQRHAPLDLGIIGRIGLAVTDILIGGVEFKILRLHARPADAALRGLGRKQRVCGQRYPKAK